MIHRLTACDQLLASCEKTWTLFVAQRPSYRLNLSFSGGCGLVGRAMHGLDLLWGEPVKVVAAVDVIPTVTSAVYIQLNGPRTLEV